MDEMLNVEKVKQLRKQKGPSVLWMIQYLGLSRSSGYLMFRKGLLPEDPLRRQEVLGKLAGYLGVEAGDLLLRLKANRRTA